LVGQGFLNPNFNHVSLLRQRNINTSTIIFCGINRVGWRKFRRRWPTIEPGNECSRVRRPRGQGLGHCQLLHLLLLAQLLTRSRSRPLSRGGVRIPSLTDGRGDFAVNLLHVLLLLLLRPDLFVVLRGLLRLHLLVDSLAKTASTLPDAQATHNCVYFVLDFNG
jgi:hypothetical protein